MTFDRKDILPDLKMFLLIAIIVVLIIGLIVVLMCLSVNGVLFAPSSDHIWDPGSTFPHEKLMIEDSISAWHFNNFPDSKTILYCHGNYGNISHKDDLVNLCLGQRLNLLLFDYRGYGRSKGYPSQFGLYEDGDSVYRYLSQRVDPDRIIIWGESLGGAVATYIASKYPCSSLILLSTFSSLDDIISDSSIVRWPVAGPCIIGIAKILGMLMDRMSNKTRIRDVKCPIVIIHSREDGLIPFANAERTFNSISHGCKLFIEIKGIHSNPELNEDLLRKIFTFCCIDATACAISKDILERIRNRQWDILGKPLIPPSQPLIEWSPRGHSETSQRHSQKSIIRPKRGRTPRRGESQV